MTIFDKAKKLAARGFHVFPIIENSKLPLLKEFTEISTDNAKDLGRFWYDSVLEMEHHHNIGIATSKFKDGALLVVDVDNKKGKNGSATVLQLELNGFEFPRTLMQKTPTGGYHYIYKVSEPIKQGVSVLGKGLDIRSRGGYILGAGSVIDGKPYKINNLPIVEAPIWIVAKCKEVVKKARKKKLAKKVSQKGASIRAKDYLLNHAPIAIEGAHGDQTTFIVANKLKDIGVTEDNCLNLMLDNWNENCQPPWAPDELKIKIENAYSYGQNTIGADSPEADFDVIETEEEMKDPIEELNSEFAFIVIGGKSTILRQTEKGVDYIGVQAFHDLLKASTIQTGSGKRKQLTQMWLASHKRVTYNSVELLPCKKAPLGVYNLWRGFTCTPLEKAEDATKEMIEGVRLFNEHALKNVCLDNADLYNWLMGYFAHLVQRPWQKPLTALVFKGKKGVGKNAFIDRIGNLFGSHHYMLTSSRRYLVSNFNKHFASLILFALDEAFWSGDKQAEGILKDLITGNTHLIEQKGREMYKAKNILRVVIIGNENWLVPATEDERRFAIFNVGDGRQKDTNFFDPMKELIDNKGGNRLLMRNLLDFDLSTVDVNDAPDTQGLLDQKIESLNIIHSWWFSSLKEGAILHLDFSENDWPKTIGREILRNAFLAYTKQRGIRTWLPDEAGFGKEFKKVVPGAQNQRLRDGTSRQRLYALPSLLECRGEFDKFIGHEIEWEDTEPSNVLDMLS